MRTENGEVVPEQGKINEVFRGYYEKLYRAKQGREEGDMGWFLDELKFPELEEKRKQAEEPLGLREGIVLLQDIDFLGHMNNSRFLRECDFARISLYIRNGMFHVTRKLKANMVLGAATIRYRRSLRLFEQFKIRSRILCWDEKAFYIEQEFISCRDSFVCATMLCRQNVLYSTPDKLLQILCKRKVECPDFPEELQLWIKYNLASSAKLKA
ncbi:protein THEM6-like [Scyliorhinus torazame]|uniref:protein THEM6-like n=1 Tax=Scyliorhinus torazame TaxID=75743 RepID=UPI003B5983C8